MLCCRAQRIIAASADPKLLSDSQLRHLSHVRANVAAEPEPPAALHGVYICAELTKLALLMGFVAQMLGPVNAAVLYMPL